MSSILDENSIAAIKKAAETIAKHATEPNSHPANDPMMNGILPMILSPPAISFIDGLKHLLSLDNKLLRVCIIIESESPLNRSPIHDDNMEQGELLVSFGIHEEGEEFPQFVNFGLNLEEDLSNIAGMYTTIAIMEDRLRNILGGHLNPDGSDITGGEV